MRRAQLEVITVRMCRFARLDDCSATIINGNGETVRLCILIQSATQYMSALHQKWKNILRAGTELEVEVLVDLGFQLIVNIHNPAEKQFDEMYKAMVENGEVNNDDDIEEDCLVSSLMEVSHSGSRMKEAGKPMFQPYTENACELNPNWRNRVLEELAAEPPPTDD